MAIIKCPECGNQVSDAAVTCPHCGIAIAPAPASSVQTPQPTPLGEQEKHMLSGSVGTITGMLLLVAGILLLFVILPVGIIILVAGSFILYKSNQSVVGTHKVVCPYCGISGTMESPMTSYKCPACGKKSVKKNDYLHPVL